MDGALNRFQIDDELKVVHASLLAGLCASLDNSWQTLLAHSGPADVLDGCPVAGWPQHSKTWNMQSYDP